MKKLIFTLLICLLSIGASKATTVIFNPDSFPTESLPDGMTIIDTAGGKYLRIVLNDWNSNLTLPAEVEIPDGENVFYFQSCYDEASSGFDAKITNSFVQLVSSDWATKYPCAQASSGKFKQYSAAVESPFTVGILQFAGQETSGWSAVTGGILYVGKIESAEKAPAIPSNVNVLKSSVRLYPNPASEKLVVSAQGLNSVEIIDLTGKIVLKSAASGNNISLNVSGIVPGIYMVKSNYSGNSSVQKVVIK